ncbi:MAG TPA: bifunctional diaminohydroxyphosphoribosylaminopyrimidine deaminase/5-amino-6-(5-phosphoribosylamino)uracil reductase RibD [Ferruginibacter sp.]|nr:bifunctional diaminohydroxyphosphoribosylaminopyrimidine deaminase/5-amino-6-(5-phosphoribosylamino)uracil reductase RibD [Ferruginibacter sp.]HRO16621.1 bifunctional diaminohydroxyphosphoribosylaminopyrimidine deaminase/5-amino-6-(5-phosphoribosylamino)uracil reductase RibD [Ferruginibacter sp.]HRQ20777.1 bifunctional diaminohydroxyphosphoribosylaminopyrimidine deaminase/5-amino-6-(5-phosphoribosylamino)uracil reductase RibD [Ferruginibacter sp.]
MNEHEIYMQRCFQLAALGKGKVAPNPLVGAVLVYQQRVIGEGYHRCYGGPHAEVHCIDSVTETDKCLIPESTLYVSLEPCNHFGKTPPCTDKILKHGIPRVVISVTDPFEAVNGSAIRRLREAGVEVITGVLESEGRRLVEAFYTFHTRQRPFIVLKWAQTADGFMGSGTRERLKISDALTDLLVHRWRSELAGIAVGTETALADDPLLTNRRWPGKSPVRILLDRQLRVPSNQKIFQEASPLLVMNSLRSGVSQNISHVKIDDWDSVDGLLESWYHMGIQSVLIEGGQKLLISFMRSGKWDELRVIVNTQMKTGAGLKAPDVPDALPEKIQTLNGEEIRYYRNLNNT